MLFSLSLILILGFSLSGIFNRLRLPGLLGMILTGIILGPYALNLISPDILDISSDLREIALIIILTRAGLNIDIKDLKKVGRPAILMCFVPALFEITAVTLLAPIFFNISYIEAAIMGSVLAAVSPAVIVPRMIHLIDSGYGKDKSIPQLIMAGASVDDIFVIVLFASFMGMYSGEGFNPTSLLLVPVSIISGMGLGIISGFIFVKVFKAIHVRDTVKVLIMLSIAFLFVSFEDFIKPYFPVSGLLAVMAFSATILSTYEVLAKRITGKFSKIWVAAEVLLFVLVGAAVDISYLKGAGIASIVFILSALVFRIVGVNVSLLGTSLDKKERIFCSIAYLPKATVQAAIGAVPLAAGVGAGNLILTVAVVAILISAPLGAIGVDNTYKKLLHKSKTAFSQIP
ncbi:putative Na(+)/H(+) antiporter [Acetoanaerobium sticklandii]|uniref:Putative Na(+)/H(+) antiporter n=1 Tax=Acetoanaerobium sticklandii (strain ATCC 12662 / DSM 519 / JCM 1433 / CCUG 9281 / NCIMB 10654 / HF) TaxID=499177 RepID=E3PR21_ACESD|nr:cation:proton antiporter [Acetoanaerobium sticklandii]CBH20236.1 putative Na(+)/H(+) antiporter [Acetoanaerobium sticklandii]